MGKYYFGIDIGGTEIKFGLFDNSKRLLSSTKCPTPQEDVRVAVVNIIYETIVSELKIIGSNQEALAGIGMTVPGPVLNNIVTYCANINFGRNFDIVSAVKKKFKNDKLLVIVGNDANFAAYGEYKNLNNPEIHNLVLITLGTGIGGGIIIDGKFVNGSTGSGGEIGHIPYYTNLNRSCGCGQYDCVETIAGTSGMIQMAQELLKEEPSRLQSVKLTPKIILDYAKQGDVVALKVVDEIAKAVAMMAVTISMVIDPEIYIIGGGISQAGQFLIDKISKHYQENARFGTGITKFVLAKLGNDAGFYGAFYYLFENL